MLAVAWAAGPTASDAAATAAITLNQTEFKAGDTLSVGLQIAADRPPASLHIGVVMPDGNTALFVVQGGTTAPGTISWSACSYSTRVASAVGTNRSAGMPVTPGAAQSSWRFALSLVSYLSHRVGTRPA
jgi:hypothetical protein